MHPAESAQEREHLRKALQEAQKAHDASSPMSALPPKADIVECDRHVRFVPKPDILHRSEERRYSITSSAVASSDGGTD